MQIPDILCLLGPSAAGKTRVAIKLAQRINAEIISVDSVLVYRGLDIGSAKPTQAEQTQVPHHLIDLCDLYEPYHAARFVADAHACIKDIRARGKRALLVGGTMLYFHLLIRGLSLMPEQALQTDLTSQQMHAALATLDYEAFSRLHPNDTTRVARAYFLAQQGATQQQHWQQQDRFPLLTAPMICLAPKKRQLLDERIAARIDQMFISGIVEELETIIAQHPDALHTPPKPLVTIGYAQLLEYVRQDKRTPIEEVKQRIFYATRSLVKRQTTWLNKLPIDMRADCLQPTQAIVDDIVQCCV